MPQSLSRILVHLVFSTKGRKRFITNEVRPQLHAYLAGACRALGSEAFRVGGTEDHVHVLCTLPRKLAVMKLIEEIKTASSAWMKKQDRSSRGRMAMARFLLASHTWPLPFGTWSHKRSITGAVTSRQNCWRF